jgi:GT2 family glycosyltransferase
VVTRVGVFDEGFKIAYFEDNDYHHRMMDEDVKAECDLWAWFSHYGSRTIKEAGIAPLHDQFNANREYFLKKWGFLPGSDGERLKVESHKNGK